MIDYDNGNQLQIIFTVSGSVIPSCLWVGAVTFIMGLLLALKRELEGDDGTPLPTEIYESDHEAFVIVLALVMGFLLVVRTNMALDRWMEGISDVQIMLSKWADAFDSLNGFFAGRAGSAEDLDRILLFRVRIAHWFSLMSCLAFAMLRGGGQIGSLDSVPIRELFNDELRFKKAKAFTTTRKYGSFQRQDSNLSMEDIEPKTSWGCCRPRAEAAPAAENATAALIKSLDLYVLAAPTAEEISLLEMASDKVNAVCLWIVQGIILEVRTGTLDTPPPIVTRTFQELSSGMLGFNQAHKVAMVPFPFPFAQMVSILLLMLYVCLPFYIDMFTKNVIITPLFSFILPVCYCGLNRIAIELEEPFGTDWNDVDIEERHADFLRLLIDVLRLPRDPPMSKGAQLEGKILRGLAGTLGGERLVQSLEQEGYTSWRSPSHDASGMESDSEPASSANGSGASAESAAASPIPPDFGPALAGLPEAEGRPSTGIEPSPIVPADCASRGVRFEI